MQHVREGDVAGVFRFSSDQARVFAAFNARTKNTCGHGSSSYFLGGRLHRRDNILVTGATADIAVERVPDFGLAGFWMILQVAVVAMIMPGVQ
jgi:hypothetical protein